MPVTVKVNGAVNSLAHKGSNGVSMATIPDVCKTPSPGGSVPMPYPNISQSATLANGTTTVKADGMMIAIKGSEFSLSNGDNAGVAGGVKSSTFMKESTWLLYSFDVKMDGKNACRLTDKKLQNHENTADLGGFIQSPVNVLEGEAVLDCRPDWDPCQKEQMREKARALNIAAKKKSPLKFVQKKKLLAPGGVYARLKKAADWFQRNFRNRNQGSTDPNKYMTKCAMTNGKPLHVDHVLEQQLGGNPAGPLRFLDASVNMSSGAQLNHINQKNPNVTITAVKTSYSCN
jgi:uncharacterized Zn-binding protein involved in type VI secretion